MVLFDKITSRVSKLCYNLDPKFVDPVRVCQKVGLILIFTLNLLSIYFINHNNIQVVSGIYSGVTTVELDNLAAETAAYLTTYHPDYAILAARIAVSNLHKETKKVFSAVMEDLYNYMNPHTNRQTPLVADSFIKNVRENAEKLNSAIIYDRDYNYNFFGFKTLEKSYLFRINGAFFCFIIAKMRNLR